MTAVPVTGVPKSSTASSDGSVPLRLEIRQLQQNQDQWNLYLLGLDAFKKTDEKGELSYYEIAGIHGRPYRPWGGVEGSNVGGWQGYCTHTSILFAPWHRPYLALFEQVLYGIIQDIASQFPADSKARYQQAAATFRIPYWDWAAAPPNGDDNFPDVVGSASSVNVITPTSNGQTVAIDNPLYSMHFNPLNPIPGDFVAVGGTPYNRWPNTLRYPTSTRSVSATSQEDQVFQAMQSQFDGLQQNVDILLSDPNYQDFAAFSNHQWQNSEPSTFASLEDIHNSIHGLVGGNMGHMAELDYSAFDPVFWLHHVNVDRLFAIWQALNPLSYTIDEPSGDGTFTILAGSTEVGTTPLAPFADATGEKFWTSNQVRETETFNYAYPETQNWKFTSTGDYQNSIANTVQQLYGGLSNQFMTTMATSVPVAAAPQAKLENVTPPSNEHAANGGTQKPIAKPDTAQKHGSGFHPFRDLTNKLKGELAGDNDQTARGLDLESEIGKADSGAAPIPHATSYTQYICNIKAPKHILNQSYRVHIFIGDFAPETRTWHTQDALVGTFVVFGKDTTPESPSETGCGKCKSDAAAEVVITGTVPLTKQIMTEVQKGNCPSLDKENVLPYLTKNLHWRVTLADGTEKDRDEVPGLKVSVVSTEVGLPVGGRPVYSGVYESHPEVTAGRPAGLGQA